MKHFDSLLAATDFSAHADWAIRRAAMLAAQHGIPLEILHVEDSVARNRAQTELESLRVPDFVAQSFSSAAREQLDAVAAEVRNAHGVQATASLRDGSPAGEIVRAAAGKGLLVLGAEGQHAWRDLFLGTTADRLLRKLPAPMLVVKTAPRTAYRNVLVPVDLEAGSRRCLELALALAAGARCTLLHVAEFPFEGKMSLAGVPQEEIDAYRGKVKARAQDRLHEVIRSVDGAAACTFAQVVAGDPRREVADTAARLDADLVVMTRRTQNWLEDFFLGSVTRRVLFEARCDVLVVP